MWLFDISLAFSWKREQGDTLFQALLKYILNCFLVYFPLLIILRFVQRILTEKPSYPIEDEIVLTTTRVIFTRSKRTTQAICLKLWQRSDEKVRNDKLVMRREDYLLDGFVFNRRFAQGVYLGIAPVELSENTGRIRRGRLIEHPELGTMKHEVEYALVMRCLKQNWQLNKQLLQSRLGRRISIDFLADQIARMHKQIDGSPPTYGTPERIAAKLKLNSDLFLQALDQLSNGQNNIEKYRWTSERMAQACEAYTELFNRRYLNGHIKRCHGDLKSTNLWVRPAKTFFLGLKKYPQQLLALDCIDFNPEFCYIDTLSDVAMLAIDIELHAQNWPVPYENKHYVQGFAYYFLYRYLEGMNESSQDAWPLLQYYMTEKAMVCAYVSILYDGQPELGEKYLDIACIHAQQLENLIKLPTKAPGLVFV